MKTCATCAHCDTDEAMPARSGYPALAGVCTFRGGWWSAEFVPVWMSGCPDYEPVASPQGDGDHGDGACAA